MNTPFNLVNARIERFTVSTFPLQQQLAVLRNILITKHWLNTLSYLVLIDSKSEKNWKQEKTDLNVKQARDVPDTMAITVCIVSYCLQFSSYVYLET